MKRPVPIYLDNHATTRVDPRVLDAMLPYFSERYGNTGSHTHLYGRQAASATELARAQIAATIGAHPEEIILTSGSTESLNLALQGSVLAAPVERRQLIISAIEHKVIHDTCAYLSEHHGCEVIVLGVDAGGQIRPDELRAALNEHTLLVAIMAVNNEIGIVQPLEAIGAICRDQKVTWLCDASQGVGRVPIDVEALGIDLLAYTGHKIYGPKGIGCLYRRHRDPPLRIEPLLRGGGQERGLRPGTLPVPLIVGLGAAAALVDSELASENERVAALRDRLWQRLHARLPGLEINGDPAHRVAGNLNLSIEGVDANALLAALPDVAASAGAACSTDSPKPSHVLSALGLSNARAYSSVRFGLGRFNLDAEIDEAAERICAEVEGLRAASTQWSKQPPEDTKAPGGVVS